MSSEKIVFIVELLVCMLTVLEQMVLRIPEQNSK